MVPQRAVAGAVMVIVVIIFGLFTLGWAVTRFLGLPAALGLPLVVRAVGVVMMGAGAGLALWLLKYRDPLTMITSTYFTFLKMFGRRPLAALGGRTEPLVIQGPQRYVRNPLYLGATTIFFGWGVLWGSTASLVGSALVLAWFAAVQIPFEERELSAMFGDQFIRYAADVPMMIPFTKRRKAAEGTSAATG
jgi:Phospholipid methyltransferase